MMFDVAIVVMHQHYAVYLVDKMKSRRTATSKSLIHAAGKHSETVSRASAHCCHTLDVLKNNRSSNELLKLFIIKLQETPATRDTFEILVNLVKSRGFVEIEANIRSRHKLCMREELLRRCGIEGGATLVDDGFAVFFFSKREQLSKKQKIDRISSLKETSRRLEAVDLINRLLQIEFSGHNCFECNAAAVARCLLASLCFPCHRKLRNIALPKNTSPSRLISGTENCIRPCMRYRRLRSVLTIAIFMCLRRQKLRRRPSIRFVNALVEELLRAIFVINLLRKWLVMLWWQWLWSIMKSRHKCTAITSCPLGYSGESCTHSRRFIWPHVVANSPSQGNQRSYQKTISQTCRQNETAVLDRCVPSGTGHSNLCFIEYLLTSVVNAFHDDCDNFISMDANGTTNKEILAVETFWEDFETCFCTKKGSGYNAVGQLLLSQLSFNNSKASHPVIKSKMLEGLPNQNHLPGNKVSIAPLKLEVAPQEAMNLPKYLQNWSTQPKSSILLPPPLFDNFSSVDLRDSCNPSSNELISEIVPNEEPEKESNEVEIAIIATSCRLPGGVTDESELWDLLKSGRNTASRIPANRIATRDTLIEGKVYGVSVEGGNFITQDVSGFDPSFFNISTSEAENMDPQQRLLLECVQECIENAGVTDTSNVGVFVGLMETEYPELMKTCRSISSMLGSMYAFVSGRINYVLGSHGPSITVDTACSSSLVAADLAISALKSGRCTTAIVAGVNLILSEKGQGVRANGNMLSRHGMSLSFDARASGYGRSDGCVALMIEQVRPGKVYMSRIVGMNVNHGGRSASLTTPNPQSQQELINTMLRECGRDKLQYWEAHGTGTRIGDLLEMKALSSTFQNLTVGTIKASIGHGEAAAGASALLKLSLMLKYNYIPPLVNFHVTSSKMTTGSLIFPVVGEERSLEDCGVTSFGVSGTNAAALLSKSSEPPRKLEALRKHYFVPVSAKSMESLNMMVGVVKNFLLNTNENMEDITGAFAFHKNHYSHRCAVIVDRQGREIQKLFGACHKPAKGAALVLSDADVSYDMLQNPGYSKHFDQLMSDQGLSDKDKLLISFIRFAADVFRSVDVYAQTNRELILALIAFSSLPANQVSTKFLQMKSRDELVVGLAKFGITPLTNILLNRHIGSPQSSLENPSMIKIHCDKSFVMTHYNFLFTCAHLYTNGLDLDFSRLYTRPLRYVKIPTYAFNRRSLWYVTKPPIFDHYLLGMLKEETRTSSIFQNWLDNVRQPHLFKGSIIGIGAIIEVVHAALSKHGCGSICVVDIKIMQLKPVSPCLLETKVESMNDLFLVSARLDDHDFFICIASAVKEDEMKKLNTKLQRHYACGKEAAQMRPFCIPHAKNSMVMVTEDLRYASVKIKHSDSPYLIAVEASVRMNPSLVLTSFHCVSCLPSSFELLNIISGDRALTLVSSQYKTLMLLSFCDEQRCSSTAYLEQILLHSRITTSNTVSKASTSAEEQYVTGLREAVTNFQRYTRIINTLLSYGAVQRQPLKSHLQTAVSHEMKKKEMTHLNAADETDENEIIPAPKATYNKGHNSDTFRRLSDIYCAEGDTKCANIRTPEEGIIMVMEQMPSEGMHNSRNTGNLSKSNPDEILGSVLNAAQDVLSQQIPINEETLSTGFIELGLESLNMVEFVSRLNEKYFPGMNISTADIFDYPTIKQLAEHIRVEKMSAPTYNNDTMRFLNYKADKVLESVLNAAQDVLSQQIPISDKTLSMGFIELGLESLNMIEFVSRLNEKYFPGMNISTADIFDYPTIKQLADHLREEKMNSSTIINNTEKLPNSKSDKILESVLNAVQDVLSTRLSINDETLSMGFIEMGMNISIADTFDYPTIEQLAEHIREQKRHSTTKNNDSERFSIREADKTLESVRNAAQDVLSQQIPINEETLSMGFIEMGLESLNMVEFVSRLNEKYFPGMNISTADIFDYPTIKQLAERIRGKTGLLFPSSPTSNSSTHSSPVVSKETFVEPCTTLKILVGGGSQECSAYTEVFEKEEGSADVLLTSWNDGTLSIVNLHDGSKLKLDSISLCAPNPLHIIERGATVRFNSEATVEARALFFSLLLFARRVLFDGLELRISVSNSSTLANALARSFFKTLAAEKFPKIRYIYNERLVKMHLSLTEPSSSIGGNWLITGGLSGIGLTIAKWLLLECSAENLVLISRRVPDEDLVSQLHQLQQRGNIIVMSANVADFEKLRGELERIPFKISGVIHSAGIIRDSAIERQTAETFSEVFAPKGDGYHAIDKLLRNNGHNLDHFIVMSSFTVVCGNAGQLNYAVSNAYLDHQMYLRRMEGKPGTTIHWGNWLDTGMARKVQSTLVNYGFMGLTNEEALKYLRYAIIHKPLELTVANVDWETVLNRRPDIRQDFVMDWDEKTPPNLRGDFMNQLECCDPPNSSSSEKEHVHIDSGRIGHRMEVQPIPSEEEKRTENFINCPIRNATAARVGSDSTICNVLGLNVFFDGKDDFCESIAWHIEALHSKPPLSLSLQSSKRYVLPMIGKSLTEIQNKLEGLFYKTPCRSLRGKSVMMFAGQGPQYPFMGEQLSTMFPIFRKEYEKCLSLADTHRPSHVSLLKIINNPNNASLLQTTSIAQTVIFAFSYASAMLWHSFGFRPNYYLGHSVGELVAGVVAGIMTLEEGIRIVVKRGFALEKIADRGAMLAIDSTGQKEILENFKVSLAAVNSSKQVVIAGTQAELLKVFAYMKSRNIRGKLVNPKYPFHSPLIRDEDLEGLREVTNYCDVQEIYRRMANNWSRIRHVNSSNQNAQKKRHMYLLDSPSEAPTCSMDPFRCCVQLSYKSMLSLVMKSAPREEKLPVNSGSGSLLNGPVSVPTAEAESRSNHEVPEEEKGVYIVGYDGMFCFDASDNLQLWQAMKTGRLQEGYKIREYPEQSPALIDIDVTEWDPEFFGISPKEAKCVDVLQRFMMKSVVRCMENAGWTSVPKETGIFIGVSGSDFNNRVYSEVKNEISGYFGAGSSASCVAGRIAHWLRTEGPAVVVDTACSSSFVALACALDAITQGKCDHAIVGGVNIILHDTVTEVLKNAGVLSAKGTCRVFDAGADGYVRSEAVGAQWDVPGTINAVLELRKSGPCGMPWNGTSLGDPIEIRAVSRCYGAATISSIKHLVGHAEAASGIVSLLACLEQMKHNYRTAQRCFDCPNPKADFGELIVSAIGEEVCVDRMAINNFGFSGTNCSIVVEKLPQRITSGRACTKYYLAPLSSADKGSLKRIVEEFKAYVEQSDQLISDICTRLQKGRPSYRYRHCILYDFRRHIVWETGEPTDDSEFFMPLHLPALMAFAYGPGFSNYDQNNSEGFFFKQLIPGLNPQKMPTHPMTPCRFHQFIANSYTDGYSINWTVYNTEAQNKDTLLPHYQFNNRKYWPFEKQFVCNFPTSAPPLKQIYYEKTRLKVSGSQRDCSLFVVNVGKKIGLPNLKHCTVSEFQLLQSSGQKMVVLYHPVSSSINEALELIALWQTLESQSNFVLVVACKSNGTAYTEWTALCRTLASERLLPYKFVSYSSDEELESEFSLEDIFECVFYEDSYRYVERLVPLKLGKTHFTRPQHLLITGGTGGIGKHLIEFMNAKRTTVITRNARHVPSRSEGPPRTFVESDLVTLILPEDEHYDVVVHCAGTVDNALMASMDLHRFEN
ncbi:hypothetical protein COOONC_08575, partial [Cooperia oncophora]